MISQQSGQLHAADADWHYLHTDLKLGSSPGYICAQCAHPAFLASTSPCVGNRIFRGVQVLPRPCQASYIPYNKRVHSPDFTLTMLTARAISLAACSHTYSSLRSDSGALFQVKANYSRSFQIATLEHRLF